MRPVLLARDSHRFLRGRLLGLLPDEGTLTSANDVTNADIVKMPAPPRHCPLGRRFAYYRPSGCGCESSSAIRLLLFRDRSRDKH